MKEKEEREEIGREDERSSQRSAPTSPTTPSASTPETPPVLNPAEVLLDVEDEAAEAAALVTEAEAEDDRTRERVEEDSEVEEDSAAEVDDSTAEEEEELEMSYDERSEPVPERAKESCTSVNKLWGRRTGRLRRRSDKPQAMSAPPGWVELLGSVVVPSAAAICTHSKRQITERGKRSAQVQIEVEDRRATHGEPSSPERVPRVVRARKLEEVDGRVGRHLGRGERVRLERRRVDVASDGFWEEGG